MKATIQRLIALAAVGGACFALGAQDANVDENVDSKGILLSISEKKIADLTVADLEAIASAKSIERQKRHYVEGAAVGSFLIPGVGQFMTGDKVGGSLRLAGQLALVAGTMYGAWLLLPSEFRGSNLSRGERRDLVQNYKDNGERNRLYASAAVMTGGFALSVIHSVWAATDAKKQATENINAGKVTFKPSLYIGAHGMGPSIRMAW